MLRKTILSFTVIVSCFFSPVLAAETIDGWEDLRFGMTFEDVLKARPDIPWSDLGIETCRKKNDPYISYCRMKTPWDSNFSVNIANVPFKPWLDFNEENKLVRVSLITNDAYEETPETDCIAAHKRVHERLAKQYGPSNGTAEEMGLLVPYAYTTNVEAYKAYKVQAISKAQERLSMREERKKTGIAPRMRQYEPAMAMQPVVMFYGEVALGESNFCRLEITYVYGQ